MKDVILSPLVIVATLGAIVTLALYFIYGWDICLFMSGGLIWLLGSIVVLAIDSAVRSRAGDAEVAARAEAAIKK
jgi:membrane protein YdbS with pleckstrin-like domain